MRVLGENIRMLSNLRSIKNNPVSKKLLWWVAFLLLNFLLFLPRSIWGNWNIAGDWAMRDGLYRHISIFFRRDSDDIFRISQDLVLMLWLTVWFPKRRHFFIGFMTATYLILLIYEVYDSLFKKFYAFNPILRNDITLLNFGFNIIWEDTPFLIILAVAFLVFIAFGLSRLMKFQVQYFLDQRMHKSYAFLVLTGLCALSLVRLHLMPYADPLKRDIPVDRKATFNIVSFDVFRNLNQSVVLDRSIRNFDIGSLYQRNQQLDSLQLTEKPNIYLFFIESYGRVLYENPQLREEHQSCLGTIESRLEAAGLTHASDFSKSPVSGGASWLAYGSALFGTNIGHQALYQKLVYDTSFYKVNNVFKWLRKNEYTSYYLAPSPPGKFVPDRSVYTAYYGVDQWITHEDFEHFEGRRYGWTAPPPDQYTINYAYEKYLQDQSPHVFFYLTKNSHSPFQSPRYSMDDWKKLNDVPGENPAHFVESPNNEDYLQSICYELDVLSRFAVEKTSGNDIIILMGDHQPPFITPSGSSSQTMVHLFCRNKKVIDYVLSQGFEEGMTLQNDSYMLHEDLLWLLVEAIQTLQPESTTPDIAEQPFQ